MMWTVIMVITMQFSLEEGRIIPVHMHTKHAYHHFLYTGYIAGI